MTKQQEQMNGCGCGCGAQVTRRFKQGHDAKLLSQLITRYLDNDTNAWNEAQALGWTHKIERSVASRKAKTERRAAKQEKVTERRAAPAALVGIYLGSRVPVKVGRWDREAEVIFIDHEADTAKLTYEDKSGKRHEIERPLQELVTA